MHPVQPTAGFPNFNIEGVDFIQHNGTVIVASISTAVQMSTIANSTHNLHG